MLKRKESLTSAKNNTCFIVCMADYLNSCDKKAVQCRYLELINTKWKTSLPAC